MIENILQFFKGDSLQILSLLVGVVSVYYTIKQNILCWYYGVLGSLLLALYFVQMNCYGNVLLQFISILQCIQGVINWYKIDNKKTGRFGISKSISYMFLSIVFGLIFTYITTHNDKWLYLDGVSAFIALFATYLLIIKKIESWWIFAISNIVIIILSLHQGSYYIALYFLILILMDYSGYKNWKKDLK